MSPQGTVVLVFQPAEEGGAGAKKILDAGVLENISAIFGLHITPTFPIGEVGYRAGPIFAGSGFFEATINGRGGHAAIPQHSIDPILAASNVIVSLQHIVSREANPLDSQVNLFHFNLALPTIHTHLLLVYPYLVIQEFSVCTILTNTSKNVLYILTYTMCGHGKELRKLESIS